MWSNKKRLTKIWQAFFEFIVIVKSKHQSANDAVCRVVQMMDVLCVDHCN